MTTENVQQSEEQLEEAAQSKEQEAPEVSELDTLKAQVAKQAEELERWQRETKAHQATATRASQELKRMREQLARPTPSTTNKQMLDVMEEQFGADSPKVQQLKSQLAREEQIARQEQISQENKSKLQQQITEAGLDSDDERFDGVWDAFDMAYSVDGKFDRAEKRLARVLNNIKVKPQVKSEEKVKVSDEEIARKYLESKGYLITESGQPSARGGNFQQVEQDYIEGKVSKEIYEQAARKEGIQL